MKRRIIRRLAKWTLGTLLTVLLLPILLILALYLPPVQDWAVRKATAIASEETGMDISIGSVHIAFPLDIDLRDLTAVQHGDTLLSTRSVLLDLELGRLTDGHIGLEAFDILQGSLDTNGFIPEMNIRGRLGKLHLGGDDIDFKHQHILLDETRLDGCNLSVSMRDTTVIDTTESQPLSWTIDIRGIRLADTGIHFATPGDSLVLMTHIAQATLTGGNLDLEAGSYAIDDFLLQADTLSLTTPEATIRVPKTTLQAREMFINSQRLHLTEASILTATSSIHGQVDMDWTALTRHQDGKMDIDLRASVSPTDINTIAQDFLPRGIVSQYLKDNLTARLLVHGNIDNIAIDTLHLSAPRLADVRAMGSVRNALSEDSLLARLELDAKALGMTLSADARMDGKRAHLDALLRNGGGRAHAVLGLQTDIMQYTAKLNVTDFPLARLTGLDSLGAVTCQAEVRGIGTDIDHRHTAITAKGLMQHISYGLTNIDNMELQATLKDRILNASISNVEIYPSHLPRDSVMDSTPLNFVAMAAPDSLYMNLNAGDMALEMTSGSGIEQIISRATCFMSLMQKQMESHTFDQMALRATMPDVNLSLGIGRHNPFSHIMMANGYTFDDIGMNLNVSSTLGVDAKAHIHSLNTGAILLDTIRMDIVPDTLGMVLSAMVKNGPRNPIVTFQADMLAHLKPSNIDASLTFLDNKGRKGIDMGLDLQTSDSLLTVSLTPHEPILAYRRFTVNPDNYISLTKQGHLSANLDLLADDGTGLKLYSTPDSHALQDVTLSVNHLNLDELSGVMPFMPRLTGFLAGDLHFQQDSIHTTLSSDLNVRNLYVSGSPLGDVGLNLIYLPNTDGTHHVDGILSQNGNDILLLDGTYRDKQGEGMIDATASLLHLPTSLANGFIPNNMARLEGYIDGEVNVSGSIDNPSITGLIATDSLHLCSDPYSIRLRIPDDTIHVRDNHIYIDQVKAYAAGGDPVVLDGNVDFTDTDNIRIDLSLLANQLQLINAPRTKGADAFGKVFVDTRATIRGTLDNLSIRGKLNVLGKTNVTYILRDSPLTNNDQLGDLVEFADFSDTLQVSKSTYKEQNINMAMQISIDQAAEVHCLLDENGSDHLDLQGGGDFSMTYNSTDGIRLFGRYTVISGIMDYSLMVFSLKNFKIASGSYIEFQGDPMNPRLSISASEKLKCSVTENKATRSVNFDVGLNISRTLSDMGLEFIINAPEDMSIQNELAQMTTEQKSRIAVTMLATGMYVSDNYQGSDQGFSAGNALNSFLQSQINSIAGKALKTIDIGFGVGTTTTASGSTQTDYNFSFAKRFWDNRISVIIGGKVSSGQDVQNTGSSFINNISIEYRLDNSSTRYVKAFYNRNYESLLEGEITEMGAGLVLRRKTEKLGELFIFRTRKKTKEEDTKR